MGVGRGRVVFAITRECIISPLSLRLRGKDIFFIPLKNLEKDPWKCTEFSPAYHDHSFFFDEDGHIYMIYGNGKLFLAELKPDLSGVKPGTERVLIENASAPAGDNIMLNSFHELKINGTVTI